MMMIVLLHVTQATVAAAVIARLILNKKSISKGNFVYLNAMHLPD